MLLQLRHRALYASFDRFPSPKGAATHISHFATRLFDVFGGGLLYVLGDAELPVYQQEENVEILRYDHDHTNFLERALGFGHRLERLLDEHGDTLELCHFREPWSGVPILSRPHSYATVYEVNGLPSIELPYTYPWLSPATLAKIRTAEEFCWHHADAILTPSQTIAENLVRLGAPQERITVIPNGADIPGEIPGQPASDEYQGEGDDPLNTPSSHAIPPARYLIYFGALQRWQGVDTLLRAFARLSDMSDLHLVICSATRRRHGKIYQKLAERLGVAERVIWHYGLHKRELSRWLAGATLSVSPLTECSRNLEQGCAPLKILESMAHRVPVVASDLPAVREIIDDRIEGRLVRAERPAELARIIRVLLEYPDELKAMGHRALHRIERDFTWERGTAELAELYGSLLTRPGSPIPLSETLSGQTISEDLS
jgi:glycosyltransferase involved in cell wall biosynthesis